MKSLFIISALTMFTLFGCKKDNLKSGPETSADEQALETSPSVNHKGAGKKYKPSDWTIKPFGYDFSVKSIDLMGSKNKGC